MKDGGRQNESLTILIPCLDECKTISGCVDDACAFLERMGLDGEVLVVDNLSTDGSGDIAAQHGARVVVETRKGYGSALQAGTREARTEFVIMGDADGSHDLGNLDGFVARLREGYDLVVGNRYLGGIEEGSMPLLNRYIGTPFLSWLGRKLYTDAARDWNCGLRGYRTEAIRALDLSTPGMEYASEMIARAGQANLKICEIPVPMRPDGGSSPAHLRPFRDGFRHLGILVRCVFDTRKAE